jgi:hypothetical protein
LDEQPGSNPQAGPIAASRARLQQCAISRHPWPNSISSMECSFAPTHMPVHAVPHQPGDAAALAATVAQNFHLHDIVAFMHRARAVERDCRTPFHLARIDAISGLL